MPFKKGEGGRPKGTKNKLRANLVEQILDIAEDLAKEGKGLADEAKKDPHWFLVHFLKGLIPKNIEIEAAVRIEDIISKLDEKE